MLRRLLIKRLHEVHGGRALRRTYEGCTLAQALGVNLERVRAALLERSASHWAMQTRADTLPMPWADKDRRIVLSEVKPLRLRGPLCDVVTAIVKSERGWPTPEQRGADACASEHAETSVRLDLRHDRRSREEGCHQAATDRSPQRPARSRTIEGRTAMDTGRQCALWALVTLLAVTADSQAQQAPPQSPTMTFFITSTGPGKGGDLGGLEGADQHCQTLAQAAGAGNKTWRAYLSTNAAAQGGPVNARDRIGRGPWQNFKGEVIAQNVDDLHSDNNKLTMQTVLTERGTMVAGVGYTPVYHDILTGSQMDGQAFPGNLNLTCNNWTSSTFGSAMVGHSDRRGLQDHMFAKSWNAAHMSRSCSLDDLRATGGNGLFYCFAQ